MGISERKRQKKLARKKKKRKLKKSGEILKIAGASQAIRNAAQVSKFPIYECVVAEDCFEDGMGTTMISRKLGDGDIAISVFLLDVWCLGAKDAYFRVVSPLGYQETIRTIRINETLRQVSPACARKLVEECVKYAKGLGFDPHLDYQNAKHIFGDIDPAECSEIYEFGRNGQPFFIAGPNDGPQRCKKIISTLEKSCGPDGFDYFIPISGM